MQTFYIQVYGCQMNTYDSLKIADSLKKEGFKQVSAIDEAEVVIFYTCNIREKASEKLFSDIGRIKNKQEKIIAVGGCVAQSEREGIFLRSKDVNIVFGPQTYHRLPFLLKEIKEGKKQQVIDISFTRLEKFNCLAPRQAPSFSEFVSIQEGCDNFCSYCVVPYSRGREYSRSAADILKEVKNLVAQGTQEITLLGQNVNSYLGEAAYIRVGAPKAKWSLVRLLQEVADIPGLKRLRYTTSHPKDFPEELMRVHQDLIEIIPPFVHIPVQSGNDRILKMMNRKHSAEAYLEKLEKFRSICPQISFSSDFIVGFPGETEQEFEDTVSLARRARYSLFFAFKYSRRKNTPAFSMDNQIPEEEKERRLAILLETLLEDQLVFNKSCIGKTMSVLFEKTGKKEGQYAGKSPYMQTVLVQSPSDLIGSFKDVLITEGYQNCLIGELV